MTLGQQLRAMRRNLKMTLKDVAGVSGVSLGYISQVEKGDNEPTLRVLRRLATAYGCEVQVVFVPAMQEASA